MIVRRKRTPDGHGYKRPMGRWLKRPPSVNPQVGEHTLYWERLGWASVSRWPRAEEDSSSRPVCLNCAFVWKEGDQLYCNRDRPGRHGDPTEATWHCGMFKFPEQLEHRFHRNLTAHLTNRADVPEGGGMTRAEFMQLQVQNSVRTP